MRRRIRWPALGAGAALVAGGVIGGPLAGGAQATVPGCQVQYGLRADNGSSFTARLTVTSAAAVPAGWTLQYRYPGDQKVVRGQDGRWSQSGRTVTVRGTKAVSAGGRTTVSATVKYSGANRNPGSYTLNGTECRGPHAAPGVKLTSPTAGAATAGGTVRLTADARAYGGAHVDRVAFYDDTKLLGVAKSAPYTFDWKNAPAGQHSLYARAYDSDGQASESAPAGLRVARRPAVVAETDSLLVPYKRGGTVGVRLSAKPSAPVTVTVKRASGGTGLTATSTLRFTPADWSRAKPVTVTSRGKGAPATRFTLSAPGYAPAPVKAAQTLAANAYTDRFTELYNKITDPANGYFSPEGIPYHSVETLMAEAPDHGHETTSEAWSYLIWMQAVYGNQTGDWSRFNDAWSLMERYMIPTHADQPAMGSYNPSSPATYAPEHDYPDQYPAQLDSSIPVGQDPITSELRSAYGTNDIYGMHWLQDVDNTYGYGNTPGGGCEEGPSASGPSYINTFQRGPQESVWETIPQPTCDNFTYGGPNGYLDLFTGDASYAHQWKFTDAPDADARAVQAAYWADTWAKAQGNGPAVSGTVAKAGKMGDYLRYSFFDKYFKRIGDCTSPSSCPGGSGKNSAHYLLSWYYAWGGAEDGSWAWLIGDGAAHQGYQNPMAAYALTSNSAMAPKSATGLGDWQTSLTRQLEFFRWLQSPEGAIAGGATNSWAGRYATPPSGTPTFHGMYYDWQPVYHDPPSNNWFGMQTWSMERVAEYYYATGNATAKALLDKWVPWAISQTRLNSDGTFQIPSTLSWSGRPDTWNASNPGSNANLHVTVTEWGTDLGVAGALAQTLTYYAAKSGDADAQTTAKALLDGMWANNQDDLGLAVPETRSDYSRFTQVYSSGNTNRNGVYVPSGWSGTMPNGDAIQPGATFLSIRSWYRNDPEWPKVQNYLNGGAVPTFTYHRFWAESGVAIAMATYGQLFDE